MSPNGWMDERCIQFKQEAVKKKFAHAQQLTAMTIVD